MFDGVRIDEPVFDVVDGDDFLGLLIAGIRGDDGDLVLAGEQTGLGFFIHSVNAVDNVDGGADGTLGGIRVFRHEVDDTGGDGFAVGGDGAGHEAALFLTAARGDGED